jgi:hypothetical protein
LENHPSHRFSAPKLHQLKDLECLKNWFSLRSNKPETNALFTHAERVLSTPT